MNPKIKRGDLGISDIGLRVMNFKIIENWFQNKGDRDWKDGSVVKTACCSRGLEFHYQFPASLLGSSQLPVIPSSGI